MTPTSSTLPEFLKSGDAGTHIPAKFISVCAKCWWLNDRLPIFSKGFLDFFVNLLCQKIYCWPILSNWFELLLESLSHYCLSFCWFQPSTDKRWQKAFTITGTITEYSKARKMLPEDRSPAPLHADITDLCHIPGSSVLQQSVCYSIFSPGPSSILKGPHSATQPFVLELETREGGAYSGSQKIWWKWNCLVVWLFCVH